MFFKGGGYFNHDVRIRYVYTERAILFEGKFEHD